MMVTNRFPRLFAAVTTCAILLSASLSARADDLNVTPISVVLHADSPNDTVTLENRGDVEIRLELTGFAWGETDKGKMTLEPADSLVFYPTLLTIAPKQRRVVRVGLTDLPPSPVERTYRLFFEELPGAITASGAHDATLAIKTKIGVPIFVEPKSPVSPDPDIINASYAAGAYHFTIVNRGGAHMLPQDVNLIAKDAGGQPVVSRKIDAWYVLANGSRTFDVPMTAAECGRIHDVSLVLETPRRPDLARAFGKPSCT